MSNTQHITPAIKFWSNYQRALADRNSSRAIPADGSAKTEFSEKPKEPGRIYGSMPNMYFLTAEAN